MRVLTIAKHGVPKSALHISNPSVDLNSSLCVQPSAWIFRAYNVSCDFSLCIGLIGMSIPAQLETHLVQFDGGGKSVKLAEVERARERGGEMEREREIGREGRKRGRETEGTLSPMHMAFVEPKQAAGTKLRLAKKFVSVRTSRNL